MQQRRPVMLVILDGFGWREDAADNAVLQAQTPTFHTEANYVRVDVFPTLRGAPSELYALAGFLGLAAATGVAVAGSQLASTRVAFAPSARATWPSW